MRTNKSQVLSIRPVANLHYSIVPLSQRPFGRCPPNRSGPLRPEPVRSAAPELATAYPLRDIAIYKQYVLQMTGRNFLPKIKLTLGFTNDSNKIAV